MGTISRLLAYYGHGEIIFGKFIDDIDREIQANNESQLCHIMHRQGSDKGRGLHNYTILYHSLFSKFLKNPENIFELGVGTNFLDVPANMGAGGVPGASLRGWREHFPHAHIVGADIDRRVLFQEPGIQTLYVDQRSISSIMSLWEHLPHQYDLILDDGLHEFEANKLFFFGSKHKLSSSGLYIIEDIIMSSDLIKQYDHFLNHAGLSGFLYRLPSSKNSYDNAVAVLAGHDLK